MEARRPWGAAAARETGPRPGLTGWPRSHGREIVSDPVPSEFPKAFLGRPGAVSPVRVLGQTASGPHRLRIARPSRATFGHLGSPLSTGAG